MENNIIHNQYANRFERTVSEAVAYVEYVILEGVMSFPHTFVPKSLEGQGIGASLVQVALDYAVNNHLKINPICPFVRIYIQRHPVYQQYLVDSVQS